MRARNSLKGCQESGQASKNNCHLLTENPPPGSQESISPPVWARGFLMEISQKGKIPGPGKIMQNFCPVPLELIFHSQCSLVAPGCTPPQTKGWNLRTERFEKTIVFIFGSWKPWYFCRFIEFVFGGSWLMTQIGKIKAFNYGKTATFECW